MAWKKDKEVTLDQDTESPVEDSEIEEDLQSTPEDIEKEVELQEEKKEPETPKEEPKLEETPKVETAAEWLKKKKTTKASVVASGAGWKSDELKMEASIKAAQESLHQLLYDGAPGALICVFGLGQQGKTLLAASLSELGPCAFLDLTRQGRMLKPYAKFFPNLFYSEFYEKKADGSFDPETTYTKFLAALKKAFDDYNYIVIDGYAFIIRHLNMALRISLGLDPVKQTFGDVPWEKWNGRTQRYLELQQLMSGAADHQKIVVCTCEGSYHKYLKYNKTTQKNEMIVEDELKPSIKESDEFNFDCKIMIEINSKGVREVTVKTSKIPGLKAGSIIQKPTMTKILAFRTESATLEK